MITTTLENEAHTKPPYKNGVDPERPEALRARGFGTTPSNSTNNGRRHPWRDTSAVAERIHGGFAWASHIILFLLAMVAAKGAWSQGDAVQKQNDPVAELLRTDPLMVPYYTGSILPTPQQAAYSDEHLPMDRVAIVVGADVQNPDPLVALLTDRIVRYGGAAARTSAPAADCTCVISLGETELARQAAGVPPAPEKAEGYVLHCAAAGGRPLVILKGRDRTGLLWAVSSLIQLIHRSEGKTLARAAKVIDYPRMLKRGHISVNLHAPTNAAEFMDYSTYITERPPKQGYLMPPAPYTVAQERRFVTLCKFNQPVYRAVSLTKADSNWRDPASQDQGNRDTIRDLKEMISPLGIEWYGGFWPVSGTPKEKLCADEPTRLALLHYARQIEDAGGHFTLMLDDMRFPMHPYDLEHFKTARAADTWIVTNLITDLRKEFPTARLLVCPPFYWGPEGNSHESDYGESRDAYLNTIGSAWPPEIDVAWSGSRVNVTLSPREHVEWISARLKRKPFFYQNRKFITGCHGYHYGAEPVNSLAIRYWDGFFEGVGWFGPNSQMPRKSIVDAIVADFMWNPDAYNATNSVREAAGKLVGPDAWETLSRFTKALSFFNKFYPGGLCDETTPQSRRDAATIMDEVEANINEAETCLMELKERFPAAIRHWTDSGRYTGAQREFVDELRKDENLKFHRAAVEVRKKAVADGIFNPATDIFIPACGFGETGMAETGDALDGNTGPAYVMGNMLTSGSARVVVPAERSGQEWDLVICAQRGSDPALISVAINKARLSGEPKPLAADAWSLARIRIPAGRLTAERPNTLVITAERDSGNAISLNTAAETDSASLRIRYAVLKPLQAAP